MATSLAAAIKQRFGINSELVKSSGGVFEVTSENQLIFSKKSSGRFPTDEEILEKLEPLAKK